MVNCKDCIHYDVCESDSEDVALNLTWANKCQHFKDKADVVPKSEVDRLTVELEAMRGSANSYKMHYEKAKQEVAREIFEEIEKQIGFYRMSMHIDRGVKGIVNVLDELKKKYTEGNYGRKDTT